MTRHGRPKIEDFFILHEDRSGCSTTPKEVNTKYLEKEPPDEVESTGGWIGITDNIGSRH
ncbi:MAG: hypothetical protein U1E97_09770 [Alphaproteobacteria bacterium]